MIALHLVKSVCAAIYALALPKHESRVHADQVFATSVSDSPGTSRAEFSRSDI